ncbi:glycosyltransferase [Thiorhodovibrio frisius]|uniref:Glycosyltransferase n=1 Tax=Thiorhodovibrio frisius TaxID=631362 RepID=H8Z0I2_9GAMM|nr:glycosyltransferase [Thiorhodovibrio frisius]EIC21283.1 glycosyltransferase [Thiorhodovibrio frisius]WPL23862.1 GDP-mannose-dependent alpha-(1-6)-phosphatidylinositol monomannoside mannosyltransferase [Thiorhodovibrio frisius]
MKILITSSTFPARDDDPIPSFVREQAIWLKNHDSSLDIVAHAPHNIYSNTTSGSQPSLHYREIRFHYFWPYTWERLSGRGILPALRANPLLYLQIPFMFVCQFLSLWRLARRERPALLYAHWFTPQAINCALVGKLCDIPFLFTTHASDVSVLAKLPFNKKLIAWVCQRASAYTAVSERTAKKLASCFEQQQWRNCYADKLSIIPMGVDARPSPVSHSIQEQTRQQFMLDQRPILLFIGRLTEKKGVDILLRSFAALPAKTRDSLQLVIAGDGQLKSRLEEDVRNLKLSNVIFTGFVQGETKDGLLSLSALLCLPSIVDSRGDTEGFPVVLMEGLAHGKVILASDATGAEDVLEHGENGFIFRSNSTEQLTSLLQQVIDMDLDRLMVIAKRAQAIANRYHWDNIGKAYYDWIVAADENSMARKH